MGHFGISRCLRASKRVTATATDTLSEFIFPTHRNSGPNIALFQHEGANPFSFAPKDQSQRLGQIEFRV